MNHELQPGSVVWIDAPYPSDADRAASNSGPGGHRIAVVLASAGYLRSVPGIVLVVPATTTDRGWLHHVRLVGVHLELSEAAFAMTEQLRTVSRHRIVGTAGMVDTECLTHIRSWLADFLWAPPDPPTTMTKANSRHPHSDAI